MVSSTQLCWRYHSLPLSHRNDGNLLFKDFKMFCFISGGSVIASSPWSRIPQRCPTSWVAVAPNRNRTLWFQNNPRCWRPLCPHGERHGRFWPVTNVAKMTRCDVLNPATKTSLPPRITLRSPSRSQWSLKVESAEGIFAVNSVIVMTTMHPEYVAMMVKWWMMVGVAGDTTMNGRVSRVIMYVRSQDADFEEMCVY